MGACVARASSVLRESEDRKPVPQVRARSWGANLGISGRPSSPLSHFGPKLLSIGRNYTI